MTLGALYLLEWLTWTSAKRGCLEVISWWWLSHLGAPYPFQCWKAWSWLDFSRVVHLPRPQGSFLFRGKWQWQAWFFQLWETTCSRNLRVASIHCIVSINYLPVYHFGQWLPKILCVPADTWLSSSWNAWSPLTWTPWCGLMKLISQGVAVLCSLIKVPPVKTNRYLEYIVWWKESGLWSLIRLDATTDYT